VTDTDLHARYAAAERLLPQHWRTLVHGGTVSPRPTSDGRRFWYLERDRRGHRFRLVDPDVPEVRPAFDHARLAAALAELTAREVDPEALPTDLVLVGDDGQDEVVLCLDGQEVACDLTTYACRRTGPAPAPDAALSPDRRWVVLARGHDLVLVERATGAERRLTSDGEDGYSYGTPPDVTAYRSTAAVTGQASPPLVLWSPDSRRLLTHRVDQRLVPSVPLVRSAPPDGGRPQVRAHRYAMVGDEHVPTCELLVLDLAGERVDARCPPFLVPYQTVVRAGQAWWTGDSRRVRWVSGSRGSRSVQLRELDAGTGEVVLLAQESGPARVQLAAAVDGSPNVRVLGSGEVLWWSERSGWGHVHVLTGDGDRQLTHGPWLVRELLTVDEERRTLLLTASGREPELDPYVRQLYAVHLDTGEVQRLTGDALDHEVTAGPGGSWLVDVASWVDVPARSTLRGSDGRVLLELGEADADDLRAAGWRPPERFRVTAADGVTDLYGLLHVPADLDPDGSYPVLDDVYPGPQSVAASIRFPGAQRPTHSSWAAAHAALGFVVVVVDGRGTPLRSRAFQDATRGDGALAGLEDHVAALRQLAATRPWMDLDRVGIYGQSGGGSAAARAVLRFPDVYRVAVAASGNHDDRWYHAGWGESYYGGLEEFDYVGAANATHAAQLQGRLLLVHGEMDDNVPLHHTLRLVDALVRAGKDVDLLVLPDDDHLLLRHHAYWIRRRWDYFVTHLRGEAPPGFTIPDVAPQVLLG
jgi:dipeptidyl-peptidase 4